MSSVHRLQQTAPSTQDLDEEWEDITPALAAEYLKLNVDNRPVTEARVAEHSDAMASGRWRLMHQGIAFAAAGPLADGQHRLLAIVRSGVTVRMRVTRGLSPEAARTVDTGRARSVAETTRRTLGLSCSRDVCAWAVIHRELATKRIGRGISADVVEIYVAANRESVEWGTRTRPGDSKLRVAPVFGALVYAYSAAPEAVARFTALYTSGDGSLTDPPRCLRDLVLKGAWRKDISADRRGVALRTLRAVQLFIDGASCTRFIGGENTLEFFKGLRARRRVSGA